MVSSLKEQNEIQRDILTGCIHSFVVKIMVPFWVPLCIGGRTIIGIQKVTIILTTTHIALWIAGCKVLTSGTEIAALKCRPTKDLVEAEAGPVNAPTS